MNGAITAPQGSVTFVLTDIEGSTRLLRRLGKDYGAVLDRHRVLLRAAWAAHGGHVVDSNGDEFFVAFSERAAAVAACAAAQRALEREPWPPDAQVRVRMGVHTGIAAPRQGGYVAMAVHQTARIASAAHGGQVLVSQHAIPQASFSEINLATSDVRLRSLGSYRVRDFDTPIELFQLTGAGLARHFPAVRALPAAQHNMVPPAGSLVGREGDLARVSNALAARRLVSIVGTGGVGKTRLATELALASPERWPDGAWLVECSPLPDPERLEPAIAEALGVRSDAGGPLGQEIVARLQGRRTLVILDGCERHGDAASSAALRMIHAGGGVQVLVTSTEPLRLADETVVRLAPLPAADPDSPAVQLFHERACGVGEFDPDAAQAAAVLAICQRLDGLPLAVEIAAARTTAMQPTEILTGLDGGLQLLSSRDRTRPARQQSLRALLQWSFQSLTPDEAQLLGRLSVLAGSFDLAAAVAVDPGAEPDQTGELVWSLVDKSLLVAEAAGGQTRYRTLETVRMHARQQLTATGEAPTVVARLAAHYMRVVGPGLGTGRPWVHAMRSELDTLRALIPAIAAVDVERAQELGCAIARYHDAVQSYRTGIEECRALVKSLGRPSPARVGLLTALGDLCARVKDLTDADACADEAAAVRNETGDPAWDDVGVETLRGDIFIKRGRPRQAIEVARARLAAPVSVRGRARMLNRLGIALATAGDEDAAAEAFEQELAAARETGEDTLVAYACCNSAEIALRRGDVAQAAFHQQAALEIAVALGATGIITVSLLGTAQMGVALEPGAEGPWCTAVRLVAKAQELERLTHIDLYPTDREPLAQFLVDARERLGARYADEHDAGLAHTIDEALALAHAVLATAQGRRAMDQYEQIVSVPAS